MRQIWQEAHRLSNQESSKTPVPRPPFPSAVQAAPAGKQGRGVAAPGAARTSSTSCCTSGCCQGSDWISTSRESVRMTPASLSRATSSDRYCLYSSNLHYNQGQPVHGVGGWSEGLHVCVCVARRARRQVGW
jgi:hypothetical protein